MRWRRVLAATAVLSVLLGVAMVPDAGAARSPSVVTIAKQTDGSFQYLVNGKPQVFIGMGYDPIYRYLSDSQRATNYARDFRMLKEAGVNTITGWDADKGYEQDKFDEITLDMANAHGIGVVMPQNLPPEGDYTNPDYVNSLLAEARMKIMRFKDNPALRMWGVGNEVYWEMDNKGTLDTMGPAFEQAYLKIVDLYHQLDPNHPVIYREAEDRYVPQFTQMLKDSGDMRPWLLYGMNIYDKDPRQILANWPTWGLDRPTLVSEFGAEGDTPASRALGYLNMWQGIRAYPQYVLGGAPYVWTTEGPEPTDKIWGLMDGNSRPVDGTFALLSQAWLQEPEH